MRLSEKLNMALNYQVAHEFLNMAKYKVMQSYFEDLRLKNLSDKFSKQADEEYSHATKIINYINTRLGGKYIPQEIPNPELQISSVQDLARLYLQTEVETTESLEAIYELICEEKSFIDKDFITEMLKTQVLEEDEADEFVKKASLTNDLILLDMAYGG